MILHLQSCLQQVIIFEGIEVLSPERPVLARQVRARQLWGNEVYTQDSDLVAVLMHCGFYNHALAQPPPIAAEVRMRTRAIATAPPCELFRRVIHPQICQ